MDILHRFALIIHWFSFIVGIIAFSALFITAFTEAQQPILILLFAPVLFFACNGMGWLFRFVLSGKIHFLPWIKDSSNGDSSNLKKPLMLISVIIVFILVVSIGWLRFVDNCSVSFFNLKQGECINALTDGYSSDNEVKLITGFDSYKDLQVAKASGFELLTDLVQLTGFKNLSTYLTASTKGFETLEVLKERTGFESFEIYKLYSNLGFNSMEEFNETGFESLGQFVKFKEFGNTYETAIKNAAMGLKVSDIRDCISKGTFDKNCKGKKGLFYGRLQELTSYGIRMQLADSCDGIMYRIVDAKNLGEDYWKNNEGKCVRFLGIVGDKNLFYADISVIETIFVETEKEKELRIQRRLALENELIEQNKRNAKWLFNTFRIDAELKCEKEIQSRAKYSYRWIEGLVESNFTGYQDFNSEPYQITIFGDTIEFQNGFGAWQRKSYSCLYDAKDEKVLEVFIK